MENTIFSRFLKALGVRHTTGYSDTRFLNIPFNTLFGFSRLCAEYKIPTAGYKLSDKSAMPAIPTPFIANTSGGLVIVRKMDDAVVEYDSQGALLNMDTPSFIKAADGIVFIASPDRNSEEPDYKKHLLSLRLSQGKQILMWVLLFSLAAFMIITDGLYRSLPAIILILLDAAGIFFSTLLVRKGLNHKSTTADKVCGIIQKGGCDTVLESKATSFFGLFNWSEVGLSYFSVSLFSLLVFPQFANLLAAINICCLPFSFWSVWYQKFRAKAWCTMCLAVQAILWLSFFTYWAGGWINHIFPLNFHILILAISYLTVLLFMNRIISSLKQ